MYKLLAKQKRIKIFCLFIELLVGGLLLAMHFYDYKILANFDLNWQVVFAYALFIVVAEATTSIFIFTQIDIAAHKNHQNVEFLLGADISEAYLFGQLGLVYYDDNKIAMWTNELFENREIFIHGMNVLNWIPELAPLFDTDTKEAVTVFYHLRFYSVICISDLNLLIFKDITDLNNLMSTREQEAPVMANIVIDNLNELNSILDDNVVGEIESGIRKIILDWAKKFELVIRKYRDDAYFAIFDEDSYDKVLAESFQVASLVRNIRTINNNSLTISIGIGRGSHDIRTLAELANSAIDIALSRGGDQIVVNNYSSSMEFYGGKTTSKTRRSLVKSRTLTQSLIAHIKSNRTVLVMGHKYLDMDALGACLGVYSLSKQFNENTFIIWDPNSIETKTKRAVLESFSQTTWTPMILSPNQAQSRIDDQTLLIIVDFHSEDQALAPQIIRKAEKIAMIDHHRKMESAISDPVFSFMDSTSSSACELVAELLKYSEIPDIIDNKIASIMLSGILLDTNYYRARTTTRTFESSAILNEFGADSSISDGFLKDEYEEYLLKAKMMNNIETPYYGIVVCTAPGDVIIDRSILAKVAQEILCLKEIRAVFVVGQCGINEMGISARSNGTVNVQLLLEKMQGGGHFTASATQIKGMSIAQGKELLLKTLSLYLNDACLAKGE